jgi:tetratricopeptide (TPR) repeat protein
MYQHKYDEALISFFAAVKIQKEIGNKQGLAAGLGNIGSIYTYQKNYSEALKMQLESLQLNEEAGDKNGIATACNNIGSLYTSTKNLKEARTFIQRGLAVSREISNLFNIKASYEHLFVLDSVSGNYPAAVHDLRMFYAYRDSLENLESTKKTVQTEMQFVFAKKIAADSMRQMESHRLETIQHKAEIHNQKLYTYAGVIGFLVMIVIAAISFRAFKNKQRANVEIARQKELVEEKQKEILSSIHYAKRIQTALLTGEKYIQRNLKRLINK